MHNAGLICFSMFCQPAPDYERVESGDRADVKKKKKKTRPETEEESWRHTAPSLFFVGFPNFTIPRMISDSEPNVLLDLEP